MVFSEGRDVGAGYYAVSYGNRSDLQGREKINELISHRKIPPFVKYSPETA
jgi:hypothetical protein